MKKIVLLVFLATSVLMANETAVETDMMQRSINFLIFAGILYYLIADKVKAYFTGRSDEIKSNLQKVQDRLKQTKLAKQEAEKKVEDAKKIAADILSVSKKENLLLNEKVSAQMDQELQALDTQHQSLLTFEQRQMISDLVEEIMGDLLSDANMPLENDTMKEIILKKVA